MSVDLVWNRCSGTTWIFCSHLACEVTYLNIEADQTMTFSSALTVHRFHRNALLRKLMVSSLLDFGPELNMFHCCANAAATGWRYRLRDEGETTEMVPVDQRELQTSSISTPEPRNAAKNQASASNVTHLLPKLQLIRTGKVAPCLDWFPASCLLCCYSQRHNTNPLMRPGGRTTRPL